MKKLVMMLAMVASMFVYAETNEWTAIEESAVSIDAYKFKATLKIPQVKAGVREYQNQSLEGTLYVYWTSEDTSDCVTRLVFTNKKTGASYDEELESLAEIMGKKLTVAGVYYTMDAEDMYATFSGDGKLTKTSTITEGCGPCGEAIRVDCMKTKSISGKVTGLIDCGCGDATKTYIQDKCGASDEVNPWAPFHGTWSITRNKKLSK